MSWYNITMHSRVADWLAEIVIAEEIILCEENDEDDFAQLLRNVKRDISGTSPIWDSTCPKCGADHEYQSLNETEYFGCACGHAFGVTEVTDHYVTWEKTE